MAFKNFQALSSRNQSSLITQLYQLIKYYGGLFPIRERLYLKHISQKPGHIYWLEGEEKKIVAVALVDPNYNLTIQDINFQIIGHIISKRAGQMNRIFTHIFSDLEDKNIGLITKPSLAEALDLKTFGLVEFTPEKLAELLPDLATLETDYFNTNQPLSRALLENKQAIYLRLLPATLTELNKSNSGLVNYYKQSLETL